MERSAPARKRSSVQKSFSPNEHINKTKNIKRFAPLLLALYPFLFAFSLLLSRANAWAREKVASIEAAMQRKVALR
jgi:hypothetical protein